MEKKIVEEAKEFIEKGKALKNIEDYEVYKKEIEKLNKEMNAKGYKWDTHRYIFVATRLVIESDYNEITINDVTFDVERVVELLYNLGVKKINLENASSEALEYVYELSKYYNITSRYITKWDRPAVVFEIK